MIEQLNKTAFFYYCYLHCHFVGHDICTLSKDSGTCDKFVRRFYFDSNTGECKEFNYGGCFGNANNFLTLSECSKSCGKYYILSVSTCFSLMKTKKSVKMLVISHISPHIHVMCIDFLLSDRCSLPRRTGVCRAAFTRYYFNTIDGKCKKFIFGGCNGNANSFKTIDGCEKTCGKDPLQTSALLWNV